ncbi:BTAD domain-containing putative transcriptional regulator [Dactylosporangium sp. NPDC048998]|uniref:BTAD domain-containing putative transcriptional regulator n=1 Tax=Dactylosporangium sp. NPDC048998 TaxID=3363976 RepID=UPI003720D43E
MLTRPTGPDGRTAGRAGQRVAGEDPARARRLAREAIDLEPYAERAYRAAMRAAAAQGRAGEVIRWYDRCHRALTDELGVGPSPETTALRDRLLSGLETGPPAFDRRRGDRRKAARPEPTGDAPPARLAVVKDLSAPPMAGAGGFAGRQAELGALAKGPGVVHVVGPAGAGKSALLGRLRELQPDRVGLGRGPGPGGALRLGWLRTVLYQLGAPADATLDAAMAERRHLSPAELDGIVEGLRYHGSAPVRRDPPVPCRQSGHDHV